MESDDQLTDKRLAEPLRLWSTFVSDAGTGRIGIVYHGDLDGAIGAAYGGLALERRLLGVEVVPYWVATEEYDFEALCGWLAAQGLQHCAFFDISIENHRSTLATLDQLIPGRIFIFDHHVMTGASASSKAIVANPTPSPEASRERHVPTFMFARALAEDNDVIFPDWLTLIALFTEGVEFQYKAIAERLFAECLKQPVKGSLRKAYRRSPLSRIASLVRADFSGPAKQHRTLSVLTDVANGAIETVDEFQSALNKLLGDEADQIAADISREVDRWSAKLDSEPHDAPIALIPLNTTHSISGPVASILRGMFPDRVVATYAIHGQTAIFEFRAANDSSVNFPKILARINDYVSLKNFGGHPSAAGASVGVANLDAFLNTLREQQFFSDD